MRKRFLFLRDAAPIAQIRPNVWKVATPHGTLSAVKRGPSESSIRTEAAALSLLHRLGCPVPEVYGVDETEAILVLQWVGDRTLDDLCQDGAENEEQRRSLDTVISGFCNIERTCSEHKALLKDHLRPRNLDWEGNILTARGRSAISDLMEIQGHPCARKEETFCDPLWEDLSEGILDGPTCPGSLDYNARNIVVGEERAFFIDFSSLGEDWPERRLVQYCTGLGAKRKNGRFAGLLTEESVSRYAEIRAQWENHRDPAEIARSVDRHHILFHLMAIRSIVEAVRDEQDVWNRRLLAAWGDPRTRVAQALQNLMKPLSDDPAASELRAFLRGMGSP